jgi:hypothetical protein
MDLANARPHRCRTRNQLQTLALNLIFVSLAREALLFLALWDEEGVSY